MCCGCRTRKVVMFGWLYLWGFLFCWMLEGFLVFTYHSSTNPNMVTVTSLIVDGCIVLFVVIYYVYLNYRRDNRHRRRRHTGADKELLVNQRQSDRSSKKKIKKPPPVVTAFLGALFMGTAAGLIAGCFFRTIDPQSIAVKEVSPYDTPSSALTNTDVNFIQNTYVQSKAGGLYIASDSHRYCVAPLLLKGSRPPTQSVTFFAVELDCCSGENTFFSAACKSWFDSPQLSGKTLSGDANSNARQSGLNAAQWHGFTMDKNALFFQLTSPKSSTLPILSSQTIAWIVMSLAPLFWPLAWLFVLGVRAVVTCSKLKL